MVDTPRAFRDAIACRYVADGVEALQRVLVTKELRLRADVLGRLIEENASDRAAAMVLDVGGVLQKRLLPRLIGTVNSRNDETHL